MTTTAFSVDFATPMPGLAPHTAFGLEEVDGADGLYALRARESDVRLFLLDPRVVDDAYAPPIPGAALAEVGAEADEVRVFVVANPGDDGVSLNLRAPVVVHKDSGRAVQVILEDASYPIRALLGSPRED
ncbi:MAG: flagellar assembly protein FliW [Microbacterium sp.]|nr:flagellar assembly protein FliW [Microbacterium sp.]